jgi:hypothetical protein
MATNTYKIPAKKESKKEGGSSFFSMFDNAVRVDKSLSEVIHVRFLPQILFLSTLCIIYIGNRHHAEKKVRAINKLEVMVSDLRADYTTLKSDYKFSSKQSEVARQAAKLGLKESKVPPLKIIVSD